MRTGASSSRWQRRFLLFASAGILALISGGSSSAVSPAPAIATGAYHTCALTRGGRVKCWGYNYNGQLGDGTRSERLRPVAVSGRLVDVEAIAAGAGHTCALTIGGGVRCWGANDLGQLGDGTNTERHRPAAVSGLSSGVQAIAAGEVHTCALLRSGSVECWGNSYWGQLGNGSDFDRPRPVAVSGLAGGVQAIAAGFLHTCALLKGGEVKCWGRNDSGQLGDGTTTDRHRPVAVSGLSSGVQAIAAGGYRQDTYGGFSCALLNTGGVECWGENLYGQLGDGTTTDRHTPVAVSGLKGTVRAIAAGGYHACALLSRGGVECWGRNRYGQLGDGTRTDRLTPVAVSGLGGGVRTIGAGGFHTCALLNTGGVRCWGHNEDGQLGDGRRTDRLRPVVVAGLGG